MDTEMTLSARAQEVLRYLYRAVLPSRKLIVALSGMSDDQVQRGIHELTEKGVVAVDEMGCLVQAVPIIRWTEDGPGGWRGTDAEMGWATPDAVANLMVHDIAKVEAVRNVAPLYTNNLWRLSQFHPYERQPMCAVAEYRGAGQETPAYVTFCWASMMDTQRTLCERLGALPKAMQAQWDDTKPSAWGMPRRLLPAGVAIVAASEWGAARALCMAREILDGWMEPDGIVGWYYDSSEWRVSDAVSALTGEPLVERPPILQPMGFMKSSISHRKLGNRKVEKIVAGALWAGRGGHKLIELLTLVATYPCGSLAHYQGLAGEKPGGKELQRRLRYLLAQGLVEVVNEVGRAKRPSRLPKGLPVTLSRRGQGARRYAATQDGRVLVCSIHGGKQRNLFSRTQLKRLRTVVRDKVLLHLMAMSWMARMLDVPGARTLDLRDLDELYRNWRKIRVDILVYTLTLACTLQLHCAPERTPTSALTHRRIANIWAQLEEGLIEDRWLYRHQDIVYEILIQLRAAHCPFAPGWQARTNLVGRRYIDPDAVVLVETPWGRIWCYLEVELSDRTDSAVKPRCDKYGSRRRRDSLPVLIVCQDDQAERSFHRAAKESESPPRMLTATISRLEKGGVFGRDVWSLCGQPVTLAP